METRLSGGDVALEPQTDDGEESYAPIAYLADDANEPTRVMEAKKRDWLAGDGIALALDSLDARSRRIVEERWLKVNDDSSGGMTLHDLAGEYGVSAERIRQIEVAAMKKMRKALGARGVSRARRAPRTSSKQDCSLPASLPPSEREGPAPLGPLLFQPAASCLMSAASVFGSPP